LKYLKSDENQVMNDFSVENNMCRSVVWGMLGTGTYLSSIAHADPATKNVLAFKNKFKKLLLPEASQAKVFNGFSCKIGMKNCCVF